jgi:hypothetical protein
VAPTALALVLKGPVAYNCRSLVWPGHSEPAPTSAPSRMDDMRSGNSFFLLGSSSLANHGG